MTFLWAASLVLGYLARRSGRSGWKVSLVTLSAVAAHLSYDVFAGNGFFYILSPLSFASFRLPLWTWAPLFLVAFALNLLPRVPLRLRVKAGPTTGGGPTRSPNGIARPLLWGSDSKPWSRSATKACPGTSVRFR